MCDPTALAVASLVLTGAGAVAKNKAQNDAHDANAEAAMLSQREASKDISLLQQQTVDQATRTIYETDRAARSTQALARVSAGEAGVTGVSVEALMGDIDRKLGEFKSTTARNTDMALDALQREKVSGRTVAQSRINAVPRGNPFALGIELAGAGLSFWAGQINRGPSSSSSES